MNKIILTITCIIAAIIANAQSPSLQWVENMGGTAAETSSKSITTDAAGNVYTTGYFIGTVDFDPGSGSLNLSTAPNDVSGDVFITKCNSSGNLIWAKQMGGTSQDYTTSIAVDPSGNVYITGNFYGTADFNPGVGTFNYTSAGYSDIFIAKLDGSGNFVWAKRVGGTDVDGASSIAVDPSFNVLITGVFSGSVDFDPGLGTYNLTTTGAYDIFILKLYGGGSLNWAKDLGENSDDYGITIASDASGNVHTMGTFIGTTDFDPGAGIYNLTSSDRDVFVLKLNASGNFIWAKQLGGTGIESGAMLRVDVSGQVYIAGYFTQTADFDPGPGTFSLTPVGIDIFVSKLDNSGNFIWAKQIKSSNTSFGSVRSFVVDNSGNVYTTGIFSGSIDFDPGLGAIILNSQMNGQDAFISKLDLNGNFMWAQQIGGAQADEAASIALDGSGNIYTTGNFRAIVDFDSGPGISYLTANGNPDAFLLKLSQCTQPSAIITPAGPTTFCSGGSVILNANSGTGLTYKWKNNGLLISGATASSYTATLNGSYAVEITNSSGCMASSFPTIVSINPLPSATITPTGSTTFCTGGSVTLNAGSGTGITYLWKKNNVTISGATSPGYVATTTGSYTCYLSNACGAVTSNSIQVTVPTGLPSAPGAITTTGGIVKVCPGNIRTYSVVAVAGVTYTWTPCAGSTITSGQNTNSVTIQYNAGFPASDTLRVVANNACGTGAQRKLKITRDTPGTPSSIIGDPYGVCNLSGKPYSVTNVTGITYAWSFNTGTATVASGQGLSAMTANFGAGFISGTLSVTATNGCGTSAARLKTIYSKPATPASITGSTGVCLNQQDVPYSITPLIGAANYTWTGPAGSHISDGVTTSASTTLITTATAVTVDFATTAGSVKVRGNNACASGSYKSLVVAFVCREGEFSPALTETRIYPNPASTEFTLETDDTSNPFDVEVYDAYGKLVFSDINQNSGYQVNITGWADGLYLVVVHNGVETTTQKLAIRK